MATHIDPARYKVSGTTTSGYYVWDRELAQRVGGYYAQRIQASAAKYRLVRGLRAGTTFYV